MIVRIIFIAFFILSIKSVSAQNAAKPVFEKTQNANLPVGSKAPSVTLQGINGKPLNLQQFKGKTIILDVWATWCVPCRAELPVLDSLAATYAAKDVVMVAVCSADSKKNFDAFIRDNTAGFKNIFLFDPLGKSTQKNSFRSVYGINGFPTTMVIDKKGIITGYGFNSEEINQLLINSLK